MKLTGIHHLTAITSNARENVQFYTQTLGLRLVKKTVNQDDVSAYHFFYADGKGSPGTDITFFDWNAMPERRGTNSIVRSAFRVGSRASLDYWVARIADSETVATAEAITERDGRTVLDFCDPEGQRLSFVMDPASAGTGHPWEQSPVPAEHQIIGLGPITISVPDIEATRAVVTHLMGMREERVYTWPASNGTSTESTVHVFVMGDGGASAELHVAVEPSLSRARSGAGGAHHVAFRVPTFEEYDQWVQKLEEYSVPSSGPIDRFYFKSLYFREPNGILFELATDLPGFATDESLETMGEKLALPPFLEGRRAVIEAGLKPI